MSSKTEIKSLVVQHQSILDKHGQERAAMAETLEGVLVISAKDAGESDRADATFKTLLRAGSYPRIGVIHICHCV